MEQLNKKRTRAKRILIPEVDLKDSPYTHLFSAFVKAIKKLEVDSDKVNGLIREYINATHLLRPYKLSFGKDALAESTLSYRLRHIKPEDFADDFLVLENTTGNWEPKYFINRLNIELLRKIYLPHTPQAIRYIADKNKPLDDIFRKATDEYEEDGWL